MVLGDEMNPLFTSGTTNDNGMDEDRIVLDVTEPLDETTATVIGNYDSNGTIALGGSTVTLNTAGDEVTIEAAGDTVFGDVIAGRDCTGAGLDIAANNLISMPGVLDLNMNAGVAVGVLDFQVADGISPRVLDTSVMQNGSDINQAACADNQADGSLVRR